MHSLVGFKDLIFGAMVDHLHRNVACISCGSRIVGSRFMQYDFPMTQFDFCATCAQKPYGYPLAIIQCPRAVHRRELEPLQFSATATQFISPVACSFCHQTLSGYYWACVQCRGRLVLHVFEIVITNHSYRTVGDNLRHLHHTRSTKSRCILGT